MLSRAFLAALLVAVSFHAFADSRLDGLITKTIEYLNLGEHESALATARQATAHARSLQQPDPTSFANALNNHAYLLLVLDREPQTADRLWQEGLDVLAESGLDFNDVWFRTMYNISAALIARGDRRAADSRIANMIREAERGGKLGTALAQAASFYYAHKEFGEAARLAIRVMDVEPELLRPAAAQIYREYVKTTDLLLEEGDMPGAAALADALLKLARTYFPDDVQMIRNALFRIHSQAFRAKDYLRAANALTEWAEVGRLAENELAYVDEMARSMVTAAQLSSYKEKRDVQLDYARLAIAFARALGRKDDPRLGWSYRELAAAQSNLQQFEEAAKSLRRALTVLLSSAEGRQGVHLIYADMANNAWLAGDLSLALNLFARAETSYAEGGDRHRLSDTDQAILLFNRAGLHVELKQFEKAAQLLARAVLLHEESRRKRTFKWNDETLTATFLDRQALVRSELGDRDGALEQSVRAIELSRRFYPEQHPERARRLANAADLRGVYGMHDEAEQLMREAVAIYRDALPDDVPDLVEAEFKLALTLLVQGKFEEASVQLNRVAEARKSPAYRERMGEAVWEFELSAWAQLHADRPEAAFEALQWTQIASSARALSGAADRLSVSDNALSTLIRERQDLLLENTVRTKALMTSLASSDGTEAQFASGRDRLSAIERRLQEIDGLLSEKGFDLIGLGAVRPLTIPAVQRLLRPGEVLVTFLLPGLKPDVFPGTSGSSNRVIAISKDTVKWGEIAEISRRKLTARGQAFRCQMAVADTGCRGAGNSTLRAVLDDEDEEPAVQERSGFDFSEAKALYRDLFGSVEELVSSKKHLIVVPPGDLLSLPFHALVVDGGGNTLKQANWLIRRQAVSILPSVPSLRALRSESVVRQPAERNFLGIGDPVIGSPASVDCGAVTIATLRAAPPDIALFDQVRPTALPIADVARIASLPRLPDTVCELQALRSALGGREQDLLMAEDATERRLKKLDLDGALADYRVLAFATHGLVAGEGGGTEPGLVMTPPKKGSVDDDGLLTASEVSALKLNADFVVLSACNTAAGERSDAQGLSGLARAFFHAGARALLVTHWSVYSEAAVRLTTATFAARRKNPDIGRAEALRSAMLSIIDDPTASTEQIHPAYWAPFAVVGEGG